MRGIYSFRLKTQKYCMLTDPFIEVLATIIFLGGHLWRIEGTMIPVVCTRRWDKGRVLYC
ncbi:MAG: type 1 glutamine amidotransferase [Paracoccaceae bacterium]|jgi:type 1 glutamine amidotransferase